MAAWLKNHRPVYRHADLKRLIDPATIAIVGLSRNEQSLGARALANLGNAIDANIYGVNPRVDELHGVPCYATVAEIPVRVDCAIIATPIDAVEPLVEQCAAAGVGGCVVFASGYAETGLPERVVMQARLAEIARTSGMRIVGPNCIGLVNNVRRLGLLFVSTYASTPWRAGPIGLVSQSGGLGQTIAQVVQRGGSFSHFLAAGNSCDVDVCDYVNYLVDDPNCRVIACVAEGLKDGERLLEAGERAHKADKPIIMYKSATAAAAASAAMSHTGTLAGSNAAFDAAYRRVGIVKVDNIEDVYEAAAFFAKAGRPKAKGVAAMGASGGACVITLDKAEAHNVPMPKPTAETQAELERHVPTFGSPGNPCDFTAQAGTDRTLYRACGTALLSDPNYAALVVMMPSISERLTPPNIALYSELAAAAGKPVCISWMSEWRGGPGAEQCESDPNVALFRSTDACYRTLSAWLDRETAVKAERPPPRLAKSDTQAKVARDLLRQAKAKLSEREGKQVLAAYGVPVTSDSLVASADAAVAAAISIGFPVVLKVDSPDVAHKTEAGVVRLNLADASAVGRAYDEIMTTAQRVSPKLRINGVLVQPMIGKGHEIVVGATIDATFGPMVVVGMGGVLVEILRDSTAELAPVSATQARAMLARLKSYRILEGYRGDAGVNLDKLADIIVRVSQLAVDLADQIAEIDVNPIIGAGERLIAVDALIVRADGA
ncbi:acetate--CoA ligase family protein [Terricaulis silvestris]|uniref:Succinyl-CoA synthetase subunit alpha n=1 Tax=Terricaulis silvestris TaxID=2686094 RepID=A0A6I6MGE6_9CAUL|nr:acetate--CoA ligase family protein [Terricaulis silvestris]QGZ93690.1 succinyl-CoA synthetase subunit alpha [Terricaulis silvestris]